MKKILSLFVAVLFAGTLFGQVYQLVKVTSVEDGKLYVIEQKDKGRVLTGYSANDALKSTDSYVTAGLLGNEEYVWKAEDTDSNGEFTLLNMERYEATPSGHVYISNASGQTKLVMGNTGSEWRFTFTGDVALIDHPNNSNRFIGETADGAGTYKAYASGNLSSYNHDFYVYELQEATDPYLVANPTEIDFGTVVKDATVESQSVEVIFGNLTGEVTYSLSDSDPFAVSGSISASGDMLTIAPSTATAGEYSVTLTISSAADNKSVAVSLKMKVLDGADPDAQYGLFTGELEEGDYLIVEDGKAMKNLVFTSANRLQFEEVTPVADCIAGPAVEIIWHIAQSGEYWTIYNAAANAYAASTGSKNTAQMLADGTDDKAMWSVSLSNGVYQFVNKANAAVSPAINSTLHCNNTYGFACYASGNISLYKKGVIPAAIENTMVKATAVKVLENGQLIIIKDGVRYNVAGQIVR